MFRALIPASIFRRATRRGRRLRTQAAIVEMIEPRLLLSATNTQPIDDISLTPDNASTSIVLTDHFDDPQISGSTVEITTPLGNFYVETFDTVTPLTVNNFLSLIDTDNYADMFIHRSVSGFVIQGGGFTYAEGATGYDLVANNGTVDNEFDNWFDPELGGLQAGTPVNLRGTLAMAKQANNPDSATSQWFISLADNSSILDPQNGGFTVFAQVLFDGMDVVDAIADLQVINATGAFAELPLRDYTGGGILRENLVTTSTQRVDELAFQVMENTNDQIVTATVKDGGLQLAAVDGQAGTAMITVQATDLNGNVVTDTFMVTVENDTQPVLTAPEGVVDSKRPEFSWASVTGFDQMELWVNQIGGTNAIIHETGLSGTSFTPAQDLPDGRYRAWARGHNAQTTTDWSPVTEFSIGIATPDAVTVTGPAGQIDGSRPTIEWTAADGTEFYDLWVNQVGGENQVIRNESLTQTSFTPDSDLADGTYRVWVQARNSSGRSAWSSPLTFEVGAAAVPTINGPGAVTADGRSAITWSYSNKGATFELWVNQIGGTARIIHDTAVTGTRYVPTTALPDGSYRAWVREAASGQPPGGWSPAYEFSVSSGNATGIVTGIKVQADGTNRPTFNWAAAENAVRYELWINQTGGETRIVHDMQITQLQFTVATDLPAGSYRGWLRAFNSDDVGGLWSSAIDFVIA